MKTVIGLDNTYLSNYCDLSFQVFRSISSIIISILNPLVILRVWLALIGTRIEPSIVLDRIFSLVNEEAFWKYDNLLIV